MIIIKKFNHILLLISFRIEKWEMYMRIIRFGSIVFVYYSSLWMWFVRVIPQSSPIYVYPAAISFLIFGIDVWTYTYVVRWKTFNHDRSLPIAMELFCQFERIYKNKMQKKCQTYLSSLMRKHQSAHKIETKMNKNDSEKKPLSCSQYIWIFRHFFHILLLISYFSLCVTCSQSVNFLFLLFEWVKSAA